MHTLLTLSYYFSLAKCGTLPKQSEQTLYLEWGPTSPVPSDSCLCFMGQPGSCSPSLDSFNEPQPPALNPNRKLKTPHFLYIYIYKFNFNHLIRWKFWKFWFQVIGKHLCSFKEDFFFRVLISISSSIVHFLLFSWNNLSPLKNMGYRTQNIT